MDTTGNLTDAEQCMFCNKDYSIDTLCSKCRREMESLNIEDVAQIQSLTTLGHIIVKRHSKKHSEIPGQNIQLKIKDMSMSQINKIISNMDISIKKIYWEAAVANAERTKSDNKLEVIDECIIANYELLKDKLTKEMESRIAIKD